MSEKSYDRILWMAKLSYFGVALLIHLDVRGIIDVPVLSAVFLSTKKMFWLLTSIGLFIGFITEILLVKLWIHHNRTVERAVKKSALAKGVIGPLFASFLCYGLYPLFIKKDLDLRDSIPFFFMAYAIYICVTAFCMYIRTYVQLILILLRRNHERF